MSITAIAGMASNPGVFGATVSAVNAVGVSVAVDVGAGIGFGVGFGVGFGFGVAIGVFASIEGGSPETLMSQASALPFP